MVDEILPKTTWEPRGRRLWPFGGANFDRSTEEEGGGGLQGGVKGAKNEFVSVFFFWGDHFFFKKGKGLACVFQAI